MIPAPPMLGNTSLVGKCNKKEDGKVMKLVPGDDHRYFAERLAEPELLEMAMLLNVRANETPLAVPVGKLRRGGHIEFSDKAEAIKAARLLTGCDGFPNARLIKLASDYWEVRWGDPPPFDGCDYQEPICAMLLGVHYGYSTEAIAEHVARCQSHPPRAYTKRGMLKLIQSARLAR
jgi:hypothetical protein